MHNQLSKAAFYRPNTIVKTLSCEKQRFKEAQKLYIIEYNSIGSHDSKNDRRYYQRNA